MDDFSAAVFIGLVAIIFAILLWVLNLLAENLKLKEELDKRIKKERLAKIEESRARKEVELEMLVRGGK